MKARFKLAANHSDILSMLAAKQMLGQSIFTQRLHPLLKIMHLAHTQASMDEAGRVKQITHMTVVDTGKERMLKHITIQWGIG